MQMIKLLSAFAFLTDVSHVTSATYDSDIEQNCGSLMAALIAAYPHHSDPEARTARLDFERDLRFGWDMWTWARLQATTGHRPVFFYSFQHKPPFPKGSVYEDWGAGHFAELWYVFDHLNQEPWQWIDADRTLARDISAYRVNLAKYGDPNDTDLPRWHAFTEEVRKSTVSSRSDHHSGVVALNALKIFNAVYSNMRSNPGLKR